MLITRYNADSLAWEVYDTENNIVVCETHTEGTAKQIIKDYQERNINKMRIVLNDVDLEGETLGEFILTAWEEIGEEKDSVTLAELNEELEHCKITPLKPEQIEIIKVEKY